MRFRSGGLCLWGLAAAAAFSSCAPVSHPPTLTLEQHTLRIPLTVRPDGSVSLAEQPPLTGRIDLSPILAAEGKPTSPAGVKTVQVMMHYGRFYVLGEGFHSVWEITPSPGTPTARYRSIPLDSGAGQKAIKDGRLSRYGTSASSCLRVDAKNLPPVFITPKGEASGACPQ